MKRNLKEVCFKIRDNKRIQLIIIILTLIVFRFISSKENKNIFDVILIYFVLFCYGFYYKTITNQRFSLLRVIIIVIGVISLIILSLCIVNSLID